MLAGIAAGLEALRDGTDEPAQLVTIRRGFHTLRGSGRMVGLVQLGDTAWAVEQALNRWLQLDWALTRLVRPRRRGPSGVLPPGWRNSNMARPAVATPRL